MKLMVYSHDAFGLGNIRRMLRICQYLLQTVPDISILVVSGSPAIHSLKIPSGIDYIKLPCLSRDHAGEIEVRYLKDSLEAVVKLRSQLILTTAAHFQPDLFIVDKKPEGLWHELRETLAYLSAHLPQTKRVLLLRDVLDAPEATIAQWQKHNYYQIAQAQYDQIWVVGTPEVFNLPVEYGFPLPLIRKVRFCGYLDREVGRTPPAHLRQALGVTDDEPLVVVTPGGGGDGYTLIWNYLVGIASQNKPPETVIIAGPEMPEAQRHRLQIQAQAHPSVTFLEFSDDLVSYLNAADVVVSMAGYNTVCELLTLRKSAVIVPRTHPVEEQWIRAQRLAQRGLFYAIHPRDLTPQRLMQMLKLALASPPTYCFRLDGLPRIAQLIAVLLPKSVPPFRDCLQPTAYSPRSISV
jgi:predicted glycosyltransferase